MRLSIAILAFVFLLAAFVTLAALAAHEKSATFEETNTIAPGYYFFKTNDYRMGPVHPPLSYKLGALPLLFMQPDFPQENPFCEKFLYYRCDIEFLYRGDVNGDFVVFLSRLVFIGLGALLGIFVFAWAKSLYGVRAGLLALLLYAFNPVILGWMPIVINDAAVAAFIFLSLFFFACFLRQRSRRNFFLAAAVLGLAQASKITALFLFPVYLLFFILLYREKEKMPFSFSCITRFFTPRMQRPAVFLLHFVFLVGVAYLVVFAVYGFQISTFADAAHPSHLEVFNEAVDGAFPPGNKVNTAIHALISSAPLPFPSYVDGVGMWVYSSLTSQKPTFFRGEIYHGKRLLFHPLGLLVKTPLPMLMLLAAAAFLAFRSRMKLKKDELLIFSFLFFFAVMFLFVINWNNGIQHFLPLYPFLFVVVGRLAGLQLSRVAQLGLVLLLLWYVVGTLLAFPNYTAYFNELMDADSSYKTFAGTNNDIGQDLKPLAAYLQEHGLSHVYLSYLGTVPPAYYSINYTYMPSPHFQPWVPEYAPHEEDLPANFSEDCSPKQGIVAISITNLDGLYLSNKSCFDWLTDYSPIAHVGHTIFVYDTSFLQEKQ